MLIIDDFLTKSYWFLAQKSAWGKNVPLDFETLSVESELGTMQKIKVKFMPFITGYVLDMALGRNNRYGYGKTTQEELKKAIMWLVDNGIRIGGHGYYHTEQEYNEGYVGWAEKVFDALSEFQKPPHIWRFPKEWAAGDTLIKKIGFEILYHPSVYYDKRLSDNLDELFKLSESRNVMTHSFYLNRHL